MKPTDIYAAQLEWARTNINHNLDFIPDDKLRWKPAPEAKSVLEIVTHMTGTVAMFTSALGGSQTELPAVTDRESAKAAVTQVTQAHIAAMSALTPEQMDEKVMLPIGEFPKSFIAGAPVIELINHHGQFTYIQEMLGDGESHLLL